MDDMQWRTEYSLGIPEIDNQHRKLISLLNNLLDAMRKGKGREIALATLKDLVAYTDSHFKTEEAYFEKFHYSDTTAHRQEHDALRKKALQLLEGQESGKLGISTEILHFLTEWIDTHILKTDKKYISLFKDNGL